MVASQLPHSTRAAKRLLLRSLGVTREDGAAEGLLTLDEALTRGCRCGVFSFRRPDVLCLRVSVSWRKLHFTALFATFAGAKGDRERRRKDCCFQPRGITGLACASDPVVTPQTSPRAGVRSGLRRQTKWRKRSRDWIGGSSRAEGDRLKSSLRFPTLHRRFRPAGVCRAGTGVMYTIVAGPISSLFREFSIVIG